MRQRCLAVGDVDNDGRPDVALASPGTPFLTVRFGDLTMAGGVKAWKFDGRQIDLNPHEKLSEIVMEASGGSRFLKAAVLTLTDLDANGKLDLVAATIQDWAYAPTKPVMTPKNRSSIYVWELDAPFRPETMAWPMVHGNLDHTGYFEVPKKPNQPPVAGDIPDQTVAPGERFFAIELDRYVEDPDHKPAQISWHVTGQQNWRVTIDPNRVVIVEPPDPNWTGAQTILFHATDPQGLTSSDAALFKIQPGYKPPLANPDVSIALEDAPVAIDVLANDTDPQGDPLFVSGVSKPRFGQVVAPAQGPLLYTPEPDFAGSDNFTYTISDGQGGIAIGSVLVEVLPENDTPIAMIDRVITPEDQPVIIDLLANDEDADGDKLELEDFSPPAHGVLQANPNGSLLFTPAKDFAGLDEFTYRIRDPLGLQSTGSVTLMIKAVNDAPLASDQSFSLNKNSQQNVTFLAEDADGDNLTFSVVTGPQHGELWAYPTVATYYPNKGFVGADAFAFRAHDGMQESRLATVSFTVLDANNPPLAEEQIVITKPNQPLTITLTAQDRDEDPLTFKIVQPPSHGSFSGDPPNLTYSPAPNFLGEDSFSFQASDGKSLSAETTVSIKVTDENTAPIVKDLDIRTRVNTPTNITLIAKDAEANPITFLILTNPANGTISGVPPNIVYMPNTNFLGSDRFAFQAGDGELLSDIATVSISVSLPNGIPEARTQSITVEKNKPFALALPVWDPDGDSLKCPILKGPEHGLLTGLGANFVFVPKLDYVGADSFTYKAWDGYGYSREGKISILVMPFAPKEKIEFETITALPNGQVRVTLKAPPNQKLLLQSSTNLVDWTPLTTVTGDGAAISIVDTNAPNFTQRFYRAVQF